MSLKRELRVAIIGAGIGGMSLSAALGFMSNKDNLEIDVYEASSNISDIGAGINIWNRSWEALKAMGLEERLLPYLPGNQPPDYSPRLVLEVRKSDQSPGIFVRDVIRNGSGLRFHRAELQKALIESMAGHLHLSRRLVSYEDKDDEVFLFFEDGTTATCDLLIGMDGIKSVVRKQLLLSQGLRDSPSLYPKWTGSIAYRALVPMERIRSAMPDHRALTKGVLYSGKSKHIIVYPISKAKLLNVVAYNTDYSQEGTFLKGPAFSTSTAEEVAAGFLGWEEEVQVIFQSLETATKWFICDLHPLKSYTAGRVIIAGDAAHAMAPHQGTGAGLAIEDAFILATLLSHPNCTKSAIPKVSEIYNTICLPRGNHAMEMTLLCGKLSELINPSLEDFVEGEPDIPFDLLTSNFQAYHDAHNWIFETSVEEDQTEALRMLNSMDMV